MNEYSDRRILSMELKKITPEIALKMLEKNASNRSLSWAIVQQYSKDMLRGAWRRTHEALALNSSGGLIDGQHRLWAIAESQTTQWFYVAIYEGEDSALMLPINTGKKRTTSDITGTPSRDTAVLKTIVRVLFSQTKVPDDIVSTFWEKMKPHIQAVDDSHIRTFSAAPVRAAVALRHACGVDWTAQYAILIQKRFKEMDRITEALYNKLIENAISYGGVAQQMKFCLAWHASCPTRKNQKVFRSTCIPEALEEANVSLRHFAPEVYAQIKALGNRSGAKPKRAGGKK